MRKGITAQKAVDQILAICREMDPSVVWSAERVGRTQSTVQGAEATAGSFTVTIQCSDHAADKPVSHVNVAAVAHADRFVRPLLIVVSLALAGLVMPKLLLGIKPGPMGWSSSPTGLTYYILGFPVERVVFSAVAWGFRAILLATALLAAVVATKWCREWYRVHTGLCVVCGYDLRASKDRCPECGTPILATESKA